LDCERPDGALWFTEFGADKIGRITTTGEITEYPLPMPSAATSGPWGITAGPDGAMWFTENAAYKIGRITTAGVITEYSTPTLLSQPAGITVGEDGALWFAESAARRIARITTSGVITEYPVPTAASWPFGITGGPDGALWFTEYDGNKIGRAPACGLGLAGSFAKQTITLNFDLGIDTPAFWSLKVGDSVTTKPIRPVVPPHAFTIDVGPVANGGSVTVESSLSGFSGEVLCAEWTTVNTVP
jgi:hypothetical protein